MPNPSPLPITAILLAAGLSRRMGQTNKLLLPWQGKALVQHTLDQLLAANFAQVVVVLGHEAERVGEALQGYQHRVQMMHNHDYARGMTSSIQAGWQAVPPSSLGAMICLADMPWLRAEDYQHLAQQFLAAMEQDPETILIPDFAGTPGNPVTFSRWYREAWTGYTEPEGGKGLVRQYARHRVFAAMPAAKGQQDLDTPADWQRELGNDHPAH